MKRIIYFLSLIFSMPLAAQVHLYLYPTAPIAPRGSYQTVTAIVNGVNNKTVTWTTDGGSIVGNNPCITNEPCTVALYTTVAGTYHLTATSNADGTTAATSTIVITASPSVTTGHPRLLFTPSVIATAQPNGTSSNLSWKSQNDFAVNFALPYDNGIWSWTVWNGTSCAGPGTGTPSSTQYNDGELSNSELYAWLSMMSASSANRNLYGCHARDLWVYLMQGIASGAYGLSGNPWSDHADAMAFNTDWLMAGGYLSAADLTIARAYFYKLAQLLPTYPNGYGPVVATFNDPIQYTHGVTSQGSDVVNMRLMGNNYTYSRLLLYVAIALTFDDNTSADPALSNTCSATRYQVCPDFTAGSLHAFKNYAIGSMLYLSYAHLEEPSVSWQAFHAAFGTPSSLPTCIYTDGTYHRCFGDGKGGESSEGSWYQYSLVKFRWALNALYTAGYGDPIIYGPQMSLITSSWWDMKYVSDAEFLTSIPYRPPPGGVVTGYGYTTTGDTNTFYRAPSDFAAEASLLTYDYMVGRTDRLNALNWEMMSTAFGGPLGTDNGCTYDCGFDAILGNSYGSNIAQSIFPFVPNNPTGGTLPTDPRPNFPLDLWNNSNNQHLMVRSSWTNPTLVDTLCQVSLENHEYNYCGKVEIFANNEHITKGRTEFNDYNMFMSASVSQNIISIPNTNSTACPLGCYWYYTTANGGQFQENNQADFAYPVHSELPTYTASSVDDTGNYNGYWCFNLPYNSPCYTNVANASNDIVYLRATNQVIEHFRGGLVSGTANITNNEITTGPTSVSGNTASWLTRSGTQKAYYTTVLPSSTTTTADEIVSEVTMTGSFSNMMPGSTQQLNCFLAYASGNTANVTTTANWQSGDTSTATVSSTGLVTFVGSVGQAININCNWIPGNTFAYGYITGDTTNHGSFTYQNDFVQKDDWEPYKKLTISAGSVASARFISVLEWGSSSLVKTSTTLVQSTSGQSYEGALVGTNAVMFASALLPFTGTTYPASGATKHYVSDLIPNTLYTIIGTGAPVSGTSDTAGVLVFNATGTGNITVNTTSPPPIPFLNNIKVEKVVIN